MTKASKKALENAAARQDSAIESGESSAVFDFFKVQTDKNGNFQSVKIIQSKFIELLKRLGYRRYNTGDNGAFVVVKIKNNIIEEISRPDLCLAVKNYFDDLPDDLHEIADCPKGELVEKLTCSLSTLLSDEKLSLLINRDDPDIKPVDDTQKAAYHFYKNGFVVVSADGIEFKSYEKLPGYIWKTQILPREFKLIDQEEACKATFFEFLNNVSDNYLTEEGERNNQDRFNSLLTLTGYNLHRYFEEALKCTILLDARNSDDPDGRSGKSLYCKALRWILNPEGKVGINCKFIDGKEFREDNRFKYEKLHRNTKLVVFNDVKKGFPIEQLFNAVEDGIEKEDKGGGRSEVSSKIIISLNYTLKIQGGSAKGRVFEFEFADFYSDSKTPKMVHGHWFFRDWDTDEWNRFDNLMMLCISEYLKTGVLKAQTINLNARKLKDETSGDFIQFMEEYGIEHEKKINKKDMYFEFTDSEQRTEVMQLGRVKFTQRQFTIWLKRWAEYRPEFIGYRESRSDKQDFFMFFYNKPIQEQHLDCSATSTKVKLFEAN